MPFWTSEKSLAAGEPYELHEFRLGATSTYYRYADAPADISYGGNTFSHVYIKGGPIEAGANAIKSRTIVRSNWDLPFAWQYTVCAPDEIVHYTRYKGHGSDVVSIFMGDVVDVVFRQDNRKGEGRRAEIVIDPSTAAMQRMGLVTRYSRQCQVEIYTAQCGVLRASYKISGVIDSVNGLVLTSSSFGVADSYVPEYTGDITGLPECLYNASSYLNYATTPPEAFDNILPPNHYWASSTPTNEWISCQWSVGKQIRTIRIQPCSAIGWSQFNPRHVKVEGSNDGSLWTKVPISAWLQHCSVYNVNEAELEQINNYQDWVRFTLSNSLLYKYYRIFCYDNFAGHSSISISEIEMMEDDMITVNGLHGGDIVIDGRRRKIVAHVGDTVTIASMIPGLAAGQSFDAYPGCDNTLSMCHIKFDNRDNFKGQPNIPDKNPTSPWGFL